MVPNEGNKARCLQRRLAMRLEEITLHICTGKEVRVCVPFEA